jgi:hypothetical protein
MAEGSAHRQWDGNGNGIAIATNGEGGIRAKPRDVCGEEICRSAPELVIFVGIKRWRCAEGKPYKQIKVK